MFSTGRLSARPRWDLVRSRWDIWVGQVHRASPALQVLRRRGGEIFLLTRRIIELYYSQNKAMGVWIQYPQVSRGRAAQSQPCGFWVDVAALKRCSLSGVQNNLACLHGVSATSPGLSWGTVLAILSSHISCIAHCRGLPPHGDQTHTLLQTLSHTPAHEHNHHHVRITCTCISLTKSMPRSHFVCRPRALSA